MDAVPVAGSPRGRLSQYPIDDIIFAVSMNPSSFEALLVAEDRHRYQLFMNQSVIPLAGSSFSKLGPLDVRVRIAGDANP